MLGQGGYKYIVRSKYLEGGMKRKAMLMGMAVMTGLPGMAVAKGGKAAGGAQGYPGGVVAAGAHDSAAIDPPPPLITPASIENGESGVPPGRAAEVLAQIKSMFRGTDYVTTTKPTASVSGWRMELMESPAGVNVGEDPRLQGRKPVGVAFRFRF